MGGLWAGLCLVSNDVLFSTQRELATQTHDVIKAFASSLEGAGLPSVRSMLCMGGIAFREQAEAIRRWG